LHKKNLDWENLHYVLKVAETGSIAAAATNLNVNRTTVLRRINQFEAELDFQLFDRRTTGYVLAPGAEKLLSTAINVEKSIDDLYRQIQGKTLQLEGQLLVTTTDSLLLSTLAPHLESFRQQHPQIQIELVVSNHRLSLSRREADVAIRPGKNIPANLVGRKLGEMRFGIFASDGYLKQNNSSSLVEHRWLGVETPLTDSPPGQWVIENIPDTCICLKTDSFVALRSAAEAGMGLALLPLNLGRQSVSLKQVFPQHPDISNNLWIITHPDLQRSTRVHTFIEHFCDAVKMSND